MRVFLSLFLFFSLMWATPVDHKIKVKKKQLSAKKIEYKKMDKQLSNVAKKILAAKKEQGKLMSKLSNLEKKIQNNEENYTRLKKENSKLMNNLGDLSHQIDDKQRQFVELISKKFSMSLALEELDTPTSESVIMKEVYSVYAKKNSEEIALLKKEIILLDGKKDEIKEEEKGIERAISGYVNERKEYEEKKIRQDKLVKELAHDRAIYKKRFERVKASRRKLERKLASLKIIKSDAKKAARDKAAAKKSRKNEDGDAYSSDEMVVSSSTSEPKIATYNQGKTISPLKGARLIKRFGTYIDPIYKFKIFNKSVTLKAPHKGSKVRSVLAGKIVFAENSGGMLGKVVIVEHANSIHTIYAKLSRLAPAIKVGKKLSKGAVIGKVDKSLMFEVTKNNKHMNPMNLIRL